MKPLTFDLRNAKKVSGDNKSSTFSLKNGHSINVVHSLLPPLQRRQIEKMPLHKGKIQKLADGDPDVSADPGSDAPSLGGPDASQGADERSRSPSSDSAPTWVQSVHDWLADRPNIKNDPVSTVQKEAADSIGLNEQGPNESFAGTIGHLAPDLPQKIDSDKYVNPENSQDNTKWLPAAGGTGNYTQKSYNEANQSIEKQRDIDTQMSTNTEQNFQDDLAARQDLMDGLKQNTIDFNANHQAAMQDLLNQKINPRDYLDNMGTGKKIATGIGLFLGGLSTPYTHQGNPALEFLNKQIDRNIESQKENLGVKKTLLEANTQHFHDQILGEQATRAQLTDLLSHQIGTAANSLGTPQAEQRRLAAKAQLDATTGQQLQGMAMRATVLHALQTNGGQGLSAIDLAHPSVGLIPQEEATKEQASIDAQNNSINQVHQLFKDMEKERSGLNFANPQSRDRVGAYKAQLTNAVVGASASKRLTPESAKLEIEPILGDYLTTKKTAKVQEQAVLNMIQHHADPTPYMQHFAPQALPKYGTPAPQFKVGSTIYVRGAPFQIINSRGDLAPAKKAAGQ